ncbi:hypothetical protein [Rhodococcus sp. JVH1]|uniref:hypothetical protein n=1 Tax=Rhodococcus sp. JVH1 TaxID=745408 RepID=UPI0002722606|nr:hypothetical protein [Rhodococcus sp. JVH1]EJJ01238.1 hypothetical protein JVH1_1241 [Rhodococcus sp. JVH1]
MTPPAMQAMESESPLLVAAQASASSPCPSGSGPARAADQQTLKDLIDSKSVVGVATSAITPQRPPVARQLRLERLTIAAEADQVVITFTTDEHIATTYSRDGWRAPTDAERHEYTIPTTTNQNGELTRWDLLFDPRDEKCAATLTAREPNSPPETAAVGG